MSTWSWISRTRENIALELYVNLLEKIHMVVEHAVEALKAYSSTNYEKLAEEWRRVFELEREADVVKRKIIEELSKGLLHPIDREEVMRLVITSDDIASKAKAWTRRLTYAVHEDLPLDIVNMAIEIASNVREAVSLLTEASRRLIEGDRKRVLEIAEEVEHVEERVDEARASILEKVLSYCSTAKVSSCILIKEIVDIIEEAADDCEDVADVLRSIVLLR
ncbi:MAG: DUF47 family protein [Desulfurococcaceae archaeon]